MSTSDCVNIFLENYFDGIDEYDREECSFIFADSVLSSQRNRTEQRRPVGQSVSTVDLSAVGTVISDDRSDAISKRIGEIGPSLDIEGSTAQRVYVDKSSVSGGNSYVIPTSDSAGARNPFFQNDLLLDVLSRSDEFIDELYLSLGTSKRRNEGRRRNVVARRRRNGRFVQ